MIIEKNLTPQEAATLLGIKPATLAMWRHTKRYNLPYLKLGHKIMYRTTDVQCFIDQHIVAIDDNL